MDRDNGGRTIRPPTPPPWVPTTAGPPLSLGHRALCVCRHRQAQENHARLCRRRLQVLVRHRSSSASHRGHLHRGPRTTIVRPGACARGDPMPTRAVGACVPWPSGAAHTSVRPRRPGTAARVWPGETIAPLPTIFSDISLLGTLQCGPCSMAPCHVFKVLRSRQCLLPTHFHSRRLPRPCHDVILCCKSSVGSKPPRCPAALRMMLPQARRRRVQQLRRERRRRLPVCVSMSSFARATRFTCCLCVVGPDHLDLQ